MDQPQLPLPAPEQNDPLSLASVVIGILGIVVYCCGSFMCVGWLAFPLWFIGFILGVVGAVKNEDRNRWIGVAGALLNVLPGIVFGILMAFGIGLSMISQASQY